MRVGLGFDLCLAIYAAYAFADADILEQCRVVLEYVRRDLGVDLFDVAMLAGELSRSSLRENTVPFCPMRSEGSISCA